MRLPGISRPADLPATSAWIPALTVRAVLLSLGTVLSIVDFPGSGLIAIGVLLSFIAAWDPRTMLGWVLILFLTAGQLSHSDTLDWQLLVLVAGMHLLHVFSTLQLELPWHGWISPAVLAQPLLRFVVIQVPCQVIAVVAMLLLAPSSAGHRPITVAPIAAVGIVALAGLALLLLRPRTDEL